MFVFIRDDLTTYFSFLPFLSSTGYGEEESEAMKAAEEESAADSVTEEMRLRRSTRKMAWEQGRRCREIV